MPDAEDQPPTPRPSVPVTDAEPVPTVSCRRRSRSACRAAATARCSSTSARSGASTSWVTCRGWTASPASRVGRSPPDRSACAGSVLVFDPLRRSPPPHPSSRRRRAAARARRGRRSTTASVLRGLLSRGAASPTSVVGRLPQAPVRRRHTAGAPDDRARASSSTPPTCRPASCCGSRKPFMADYTHREDRRSRRSRWRSRSPRPRRFRRSSRRCTSSLIPTRGPRRAGPELHRPPFTTRAVLSDGGVYDNLGPRNRLEELPHDPGQRRRRPDGRP